MTDWRQESLPDWRPGPLGVALIALRGTVFGAVVFGGLGLHLLVRLLERPLCGQARPVTPHITQAVCRISLRLIGISVRQTGRAMRHRGAVVANHASWLDIFVLNACDRVYFVSKSEVAGWPVIGWLARATGTVFIARNAAEAKVQKHVFEDRLQAGHRLLFFPEGTSTDGIRILPFKSTLFAAFFAHDMKEFMAIQPVSLRYTAPRRQDARLYGWWANMEFASHLARVLSQPRQGLVEVVYHKPLQVAEFADRKALAAQCEVLIRSGHARL